MPERSPLPMARQDFRRSPAPQASEARASVADRAWRFAAFAPAIAVTLTLTIAIARWLGHGGVTPVEAIVVVLVALTFIWVSLSVSAVVLGAVRYSLRPSFARHDPVRGPSQRVALLVPIYNEVPSDVFGNALAMLQELEGGPQNDRFTLFILSDTQDPEIATLEERAYWALRERVRGSVEVFYRRRALNTDKKVGNITDWIEAWGAGFDAMVVLDADSLMSGSAIRNLAYELSADPEAGLIQSFPSLIGAKTLFGRMQQFSNAVYGWLLAEGLAVWSQREGNYWGHNAIIRVRAFADSAHLPHLSRRGGRKDLILSHDFIEAGLLRRAGWGVRFLPRASGSFEETPQTLIDYALRDRRWCQGNLQHLRLLTARGFHPVSRFHLLQGAFAFLLSPAWFALLVIWSMVGTMEDSGASYFSPSNPLYPVWPEAAPVGGVLYLAFIYGMLLLPKVMGTIVLGLRPATREAYGGWARFLATAAFEISCSIIYAPIMMVQQTIAVLRAFAGRKAAWTPQNRSAAGYSWAQVFRFHLVELVLGALLTWGILSTVISLWLVPIAISLILAPALSKLSGWQVSNRRLGFARLDAPHDLREPRIVTRAKTQRAWMAARLDQEELPVAAE
ncbi:MAG: glucans biosynthesis glucosyltransferase MdoH [Pseudomonadota bacterium]